MAFNFQTGDAPMWLNRGLFAVNGGLGYVLKPPHMRGTGPPLPPRRLAVEVLSCQRLPNNNASYDLADVYVSATVHGAPADARELRTATVDNNGLNPAFGTPPGAGERLEFVVTEPEVRAGWAGRRGVDSSGALAAGSEILAQKMAAIVQLGRDGAAFGGG